MFHEQIDYAESNEQVSFFISNGPEFLRTKYFFRHSFLYIPKSTGGKLKSVLNSLELALNYRWFDLDKL